MLKGCHADNFCLRGNIPCGASQSQIPTDLLPMHLTPTQDCMRGFSFFRQISMSHQLLPTHKPLQEHYPSLTACPLSTYKFCMAEGKYEADIVPTITALVEKKTPNPMPCYCCYMNCNFSGGKLSSFSDI